MRFVKFKKDFNDITAGVEYEVKFETKEEFCIIDNVGYLRTEYKPNSFLEIIDRPVMVKAWDGNDSYTDVLELVHDLGEEFEYRYVCKFEDGMTGCWKNIEYIEQELTLEQRIEKIEQQLNNK